MKHHRLLVTMACALTLLPSTAVLAQGSSGKVMRIINGNAGGAPDIVARFLGQGLPRISAQSVVVDNRPGANIPPLAVSKAPPDGLTLLAYTSTLWIAPLIEKTPYDALKDFTPITIGTASPNLIVVHPSVQANSVKELIALAKSRPGVLNYASGGSGSPSHLAGEMFKAMAAVSITRIPYKSAVPAVNDVVGGRAQVMFPPVPVAMPLVKAGRLRALAVTSAQSSVLTPGMVTAAEAGMPGYDSMVYIGFFAPGGTPASIVNQLQQDFAKVLNMPDIREKILDNGSEVVAGSPAETLEFIKADMAKLGKLIREAGIKADAE